MSKKGKREQKLITPTIWVQEPKAIACNLLNVGHKEEHVRTRIIRSGDTSEVVLDEEAQIMPMTIHNTFWPGDDSPGAPFYCEFTVLSDKDQFRGVAKLWDGLDSDNFSDLFAIAATWRPT